MKELLLTGAGGFVGRNVSPVLKKNYAVFTLGRGADIFPSTAFLGGNGICVKAFLRFRVFGKEAA